MPELNIIEQRTEAPLGSRILRGAVGGLLINVFTNAFLFAGQLIIPRVLSTTEYAQYTISISFVTLLALLADLGMTPLFTKLLADASEDARSAEVDTRGALLGSMLLLRVLLALLVCVLVVLVGPLLYERSIVDNMVVLLITLFISSRLVVVRAVGDSLLRSEGKYYLASLFALADALAFAMLLLSSSNHLTLSQVIWIYAGCNIPGFLLLIGFVIRWLKQENISLSIDTKVIGRILRTAIPLSLATAFLTIHNECDKLLLSGLSNDKEVANFGATIRLTAAVAPISLVLGAVAAPELTRLIRRHDFERAKRLIDICLRLLMVASGGIALFLSIINQEAIILLLGQKYASAAPLLVYVGWMIIPIFFATFLLEVSIAAGRLWLPTYYAAFIMIAVIVGDLLLLRPYGAAGAMTSKTIAVAGGGMLLFLVQGDAPYLDRNRFAKALLKIAPMLLLGWLAIRQFDTLQLHPMLQASIVIAIYVSALQASGFFRFSEAAFLIRKFRV